MTSYPPFLWSPALSCTEALLPCTSLSSHTGQPGYWELQQPDRDTNTFIIPQCSILLGLIDMFTHLHNVWNRKSLQQQSGVIGLMSEKLTRNKRMWGNRKWLCRAVIWSKSAEWWISNMCTQDEWGETAEGTWGEHWCLIHTKFWQPCEQSGRKREEGQRVEVMGGTGAYSGRWEEERDKTPTVWEHFFLLFKT